MFIPRSIKKLYDTQKDLDYTFLGKDGSIELTKFGLQHSDFYRQQCAGS